MKDYYQTLGVQPDATADQIRSAYRKLAVQWHPDRNKDPEAEAKFKEINEANDTLSDDQKRQQYDHQRQFGNQQGFPGGFSFRSHGFEGNIHDIFEGIFRQHGFGGGFGGPFAQQRAQRNPDTQVQITVTLEEAFMGKIIPIQFTDSTGKETSITVNVPPGVEHGTRLRYAGNGNRVHPNLAPGDLYIVIAVENHPRFQRDASHLFTVVEVNLWESLAGTTKMVPTIEGGTVKVAIPTLCKDQTILRVKEKGMPTRADRKMRGDLHVKVMVRMPQQLTPEQRRTIESWCSSV